jgi:hypothetical protein
MVGLVSCARVFDVGVRPFGCLLVLGHEWEMSGRWVALSHALHITDSNVDEISGLLQLLPCHSYVIVPALIHADRSFVPFLYLNFSSISDY